MAFIGQAIIGHHKPAKCHDDELIPGLLPHRGLVFIVGEPTSAKSLLALHLSACLATGRRVVEFDGEVTAENWNHGFPAYTGSTLYLAGEGYDDLYKRIQASTHAVDASFQQKPELYDGHLPIITVPVLGLTGMDNLPELQERIASSQISLAEAGFPLRAIVFDTLPATSLILDENDNGGVQNKTVSWLREFSERFDCLVIAIVYPPKNPKAKKGSIRGAGAFEAAADVIWYVARHGNSPKRTLTITKRKDGLYQGKSFSFEIVPYAQSVALVPTFKEIKPDNSECTDKALKRATPSRELILDIIAQAPNGQASRQHIYEELLRQNAVEQASPQEQTRIRDRLNHRVKRGLADLTKAKRIIMLGDGAEATYSALAMSSDNTN